MYLYRAVVVFPAFFLELLSIDLFGWYVALVIIAFCFYLMFKILSGGRIK